ncbi:ROK family protein [Deinococcus malanensis]|uniref:ROK family protein n=1 Tax=Deinococcus malanensis TaxID=1706855 RepID=UPI00362FF330
MIHALSSTSAPGTPAATSEQLANLITQLLRAPQVTGRSLLGLGVAVPGPVAFTEARVLSAPNLGWRDVPFLDLLRPHLHDLDGPWLLENEAKAAAFGEFFFHKYNAPDSLAYISLGTGIGSGFIQSGSPPSILRGAHGLASEIGHTVLQPGGPYCHCGNRGCAETLTSSWSIRAALNISEDLPSRTHSSPDSTNRPCILPSSAPAKRSACCSSTSTTPSTPPRSSSAGPSRASANRCCNPPWTTSAPTTTAC